MKPVELIERALLNSSKAGDLVADFFGGSGSTLIACERRGRAARLMELDSRYADVICRRYQEYTGKQAVLEGDGRTFDEIAQDLTVSPNTVKTHVRAIYTKLGVRKRRDAVAVALERGLLETAHPGSADDAGKPTHQ